MKVPEYRRLRGLAAETALVMPKYLPVRVTEIGGLYSSILFVELEKGIRDFIEQQSGVPAVMAQGRDAGPDDLFCPPSLSEIDGGGPAKAGMMDSNKDDGWLAVPVESIGEEDFDGLVDEWQTFIVAYKDEKEGLDLPLPIYEMDPGAYWQKGSWTVLSTVPSGIGSVLFSLGPKFLTGPWNRKADGGWTCPRLHVVPSGHISEAKVLEQVGGQFQVRTRRRFEEVARESGASLAWLQAERSLRAMPEPGALAREAMLDGVVPDLDLAVVTASLRKELASVEGDNPFVQDLRTRAAKALPTLDGAAAVIAGVRTAREAFGIDIPNHRATRQAELEQRVVELTAKRASSAEELQAMGGKKGRLSQAIDKLEAARTSREAELAELDRQISASKERLHDAETTAQAHLSALRQQATAKIQEELANLENQRDRWITETRELQRATASPPTHHHEPVDDTKVSYRVLEDIDDISAALASQGLRYPGSWPARFLIASLAARDTGAMVLLAGPTGTGKTRLVREAAGILVGAGSAVIPVRPEWLGSTDLLGYVDPIRDTFAPTDFVAAVRAATVGMPLAFGPDPRAPRVMAPWFLLLDEMNLARIENFGADLLAVLERPATDPTRILNLFPADMQAAWQNELETLSGCTELDARTSWRLEALRRLFDPTRHRQTDRQNPHLLHLPANLLVCGTLNTDRHAYDLSPKVFDRSFVLQMPPPTPEEVFSPASGATAEPSPVRFLLPPLGSLANGSPWARFPNARKALQAATEALRPAGISPSHRLIRSAEAYLKYAALWFKEDGPNDPSCLAADMVHLLLLPRLDCPADHARRALADLTRLVEPWNDEDLDRELTTLRERSNDARYGDFRGLA